MDARIQLQKHILVRNKLDHTPVNVIDNLLCFQFKLASHVRLTSENVICEPGFLKKWNFRNFHFYSGLSFETEKFVDPFAVWEHEFANNGTGLRASL